MLVSGFPALSRILGLFTWYLSLLEVNCGLLMRKCTNGEGSLHALLVNGMAFITHEVGSPLLDGSKCAVEDIAHKPWECNKSEIQSRFRPSGWIEYKSGFSICGEFNCAIKDRTYPFG